MGINWPWLSVREIVLDLGISRQRVHQIIKERNLGTRDYGNITLVNAADYKYYLKLRRRRDLANAAGRKEVKLIYSTEHDASCNVCGGFAVNWKGTVACEDGHVYQQQG